MPVGTDRKKNSWASPDRDSAPEGTRRRAKPTQCKQSWALAMKEIVLLKRSKEVFYVLFAILYGLFIFAQGFILFMGNTKATVIPGQNVTEYTYLGEIGVNLGFPQFTPRMAFAFAPCNAEGSKINVAAFVQTEFNKSSYDNVLTHCYETNEKMQLAGNTENFAAMINIPDKSEGWEKAVPFKIYLSTDLVGKLEDKDVRFKGNGGQPNNDTKTKWVERSHFVQAQHLVQQSILKYPRSSAIL